MGKQKLVIFIAMVILCLFVALGTTFAKTTTITFWHAGGADPDIVQAFDNAARAFEKRNPDIKVKVVPVPPEIYERVVIGVASGTQPDLALMQERISSYVIAGIIEPLDEFFKRDKLSPDDFWAPAFKECQWDGRIWALPWGADVNFGLLYNREVLESVGIPGNKPPLTISDVDGYNRKLARRDSKGHLTQFGLVPWWTYGYTNSIFTWGWAFGGEFYDERARKATAEDPNIVRALDWMVSVADLYGFENIQGLMAGTPTGIPLGITGLFVIGRIAMNPFGPWEITRIRNSDYNVDFAVAPVPYDQIAGKPHPTWIGGQRICMIAGTKHKEEAWRFLKFIAADPEGTAILNDKANWFPGYRKSNIYERYRKDRYFAPYVWLLENARNTRPVMPAAEIYYTELSKAVDNALRKIKTPLEALKGASWVTNLKLQELLRKTTK